MSLRHEAGARRRRRIRYSRLSVVAALLCGVARAEELALLELVINGRATQRVESFALHDGQVFATRARWRSLGVVDDSQADGNELVSAAQIKGVQARLDLERRSLALDLPPDPAALTVIDRGVPADATPLDHGRGVLLNYDLNHERVKATRRTAGLLEARWFQPGGVLDHSMLVADAPGTGTRTRRLATTFTRTDPQRLERLRVGDFVNGGLSWSRPLRMAGLQLITDVALRPGMVTTPTPHLAGSVAVPSTVDVLVDGVRQLSEPVEPGRFEIRQLPIVNGLGDVAVVVRDALGRESVQSLSFYGSNRQLARGLSAYAVELGVVRRGFGTDDDRYRSLAATTTWRHGVSEAVTVEAHGEAGAGTMVAGAGVLSSIDSVGLVGAALAASRSDGVNGALVNLSAERRTPVLRLQFDFSAASPGYRDLAATQGDAPLRLSLRLAAGWQIAPRASLGLAAVEQRSGPTARMPDGLRTRLVTATYQQSLSSGVQFYVSVYRELAGVAGGPAGHGLGIGITLPFDGRGSASAMLTRDQARSALSVMAGDSAQVTGEFGWRVQDEQVLDGAGGSHQLASLHYLAPAAQLSAEAEHLDGRTAMRLGAQGALLALGGLHATRHVTDSVAVVDVDGQPGIAVFHQNRYVGRTDADGQIVVPGLLSFEANKLAIEPLDLPLEAEAADLSRIVRPADRSGLQVRFALDRQRAALVLLQDAQGVPLPVGARVRAAAAGSRASGLVGHEGQAYLRGLGDDNRVEVDWGTGRCTARFAWSDRREDTGRVGPVRCQ